MSVSEAIRAALPIDSEMKSLADLFLLGSFCPASVQREYVWGEANCLALLADLERSFDAASPAAAVDDPQSEQLADEEECDVRLEPQPPVDAPRSASMAYYLGSFVVCKDERGYQIYDGMQRATTLTMLLALLRDLCADRDTSEFLHSLIALPGEPNCFRLTLRLGQTILSGEIQPRGEAAWRRRSRSTLPPVDWRIRSCAAAMRNQLRTWPADRRVAFAKWLVSDVRVTLVMVQDATIARQIFVSTNVSGIRLDPIALFKGQLMDMANDDAEAEQIAVRWSAFESSLGSSVDELLKAVDFLSRRVPQGEDYHAQLAAHIEGSKAKVPALKWIEDLEALAGSWRELRVKLREPGPGLLDAEIFKLRFFTWDEWKPLALLWYHQFAVRRDATGAGSATIWRRHARRFGALHACCMTVTLGGYSANDRAKIFGRAITQTVQRRDALTGALTFDKRARSKVVRTLKTPILNEVMRRTIVRWIEASMWEQPPTYLKIATVEHVLPQNPPLASRWLRDFQDDNVRFNCTHSLGNLLPVDWDRNERAGNKDFEVKRALYTAEPRFRMLEGATGEMTWNRKTIKRRENELVRFILARLPLSAPGS